MKRILINATQPEELRVALVDGQRLYDLDIERVGREQKKANTYNGVITRIEPSLAAAFVNYGADRHGFLPFKEITSSLFPDLDDNENFNVKAHLREGQKVLVQVDKEERGNKGAALTTFISLAGCYLVLMPNSPKAGGISRRIEGEERDDLKKVIEQLSVPEGMGLIVRTAGVGKSTEELEWDLNYLLQIWDAISSASEERESPCLIYQESDVIVRTLRDHMRKDLGEILIDNETMFEKAKKYVQMIRPDAANRVKLYQDAIPLFSRFQIESQIESAFQREVRLPSGGALVIDHTEALVTIDINSAKATKGNNIEETALNTNLEASDEIARQLRLRDLGGLVVIDYIDMTPQRHQREVENRLKEALALDRARIQVGRISRFGLLEMSRQRLRPSLGESAQETCPRCSGQGTVRSIQSMALSILRLIEEESLKENTVAIRAQLPLDIATFLLNEKRPLIQDFEKQQGITVQLIPNPHMHSPIYELSRLKSDESTDGINNSYRSIQQDPEEEAHGAVAQSAASAASKQTFNEPAVKDITPEALPRYSAAGKGLIKRLWSSLFGATKESKTTQQTESTSTATSKTQRAVDSDRRHNRRDGSRKKGQTERKTRGSGSRTKGGNRQSNTGRRTQQGNNQKRPASSDSNRQQTQSSAPTERSSRSNKPQTSPETQTTSSPANTRRSETKARTQPSPRKVEPAPAASVQVSKEPVVKTETKTPKTEARNPGPSSHYSAAANNVTNDTVNTAGEGSDSSAANRRRPSSRNSAGHRNTTRHRRSLTTPTTAASTEHVEEMTANAAKSTAGLSHYQRLKQEAENRDNQSKKPVEAVAKHPSTEESSH